VAHSASSTDPSEDTVIFVVDVGSAKLLLDLRLVKNLAGESLLGFLAASCGSSDVAPPLTAMPIVSWAVLTTAGALDRQLPVPPSHLRPLFGVCVPVVVGVDAPSDAAGEVDKARLVDVSCDVVLASSAAVVVSGVVVVVVLVLPVVVGTSAVLSPAGGWGFGLDFLRGPMAHER